jgi:hypothetical protein
MRGIETKRWKNLPREARYSVDMSVKARDLAKAGSSDPSLSNFVRREVARRRRPRRDVNQVLNCLKFWFWRPMTL